LCSTDVFYVRISAFFIVRENKDSAEEKI